MAQLYGPPSDGSVIPHELEDAIAADTSAPDSAIGQALRVAGLDEFGAQRALGRQLGETVRTGQLLDNFRDAASWTRSFGEGVVAVADRELSISTVGSAATMARREVSFDLTGRFVSFDIMRDANLASLEVRFSVGTSGTADSFFVQEAVSKIEPNKWYRVTYPLAQMQRSGAASPTEVDNFKAIRIGPSPATGTDTVLRIRDMRIHQIATPPAVHFQFDDGRRDTYTVAYPILKAAGFTGGIAVEHNNVGNADRISIPELKQLYAEGWSMYGHHTVRSTDLTVEQVRGHMVDAQEFLDTNGFRRGSAHWIWPGGARDAERDAVGLEYWRTVRKVNSHHFYGAPFVYEPADPAHVYIQRTTGIATAKNVVDTVKAYGGSVVFVFHSIVETESAQEDWSIAKFQELVDYAKAAGLADTNFDQINGSYRPYTL